MENSKTEEIFQKYRKGNECIEESASSVTCCVRSEELAEAFDSVDIEDQTCRIGLEEKVSKKTGLLPNVGIATALASVFF